MKLPVRGYYSPPRAVLILVSVIERLQRIHLIVDDINSEAKRLSASYEPTLDTFSPSFDKLLGQFAGDFDRYRLDEIVVAAISPVVSVPPTGTLPF